MEYDKLVSLYTPNQLGTFLHQLIETHKKEIKDKDAVERAKNSWIKATSLKVLGFIDTEAKKFVDGYPKNQISAKDITNALSNAINLVLKSQKLT